MSSEETPDSAVECTGYTPRTPNEQKTIRIWNAIDVLHDEKASPDQGEWIGYHEFQQIRPMIEALPLEVLTEEAAAVEERLAIEQRRKELDLRAVRLGWLKKANQAPRCGYLKANGKPCGSPKFGESAFCVFHGRALQPADSVRMTVKVLEDRETLQLTMKEIMERLVEGQMDPQVAHALLRIVQIARSTLRDDAAKRSRDSQTAGAA